MHIKNYDEFFDEISNIESIDIFYSKADYTMLWKNFIAALIYNLDFTFLDSNLTPKELNAIGIKDGNILIESSVKTDINGWNDLIERIKRSKSKITLFTSGTTGQPKSVVHSVQSLMRQVRIDKKFEQSKWGFTYSPTHIAGIQLFLQAFSNKNAIIDLYEKSKEYILLTLSETQLTHISGTPTFYRLLMPCEETFTSVQRVTIGGEKSNTQLLQSIEKVFRNAKINNVYASTEAGSLFASSSVGFSIPDNSKTLIKISDYEIIVHSSIMGNTGNEAEWFKTGDLIEWVDEKKGVFKIVSRINEMINVGGNKVNPNEIEEVILQFGNVKNVVVYGRDNAVLGQVLVAELVLLDATIDFDENGLKRHLKDNLQPFKIPRKFYLKEKLVVGRTGKIKRM
jgi:acyl-coenzyme A synthetase/AMP-(fatty) acid ligase